MQPAALGLCRDSVAYGSCGAIAQHAWHCNRARHMSATQACGVPGQFFVLDVVHRWAKPQHVSMCPICVFAAMLLLPCVPLAYMRLTLYS